MLPMAKILLPVDFSERSVGAVHHGIALARRFGSELTLFHALAPPPYELGGLESLGGSMMTTVEQAQGDLDAFLQGEFQGLNVRRIVVEGDPARKIVQFAHEEHADLIVLPTHGYGPFRRFILGSTAAKVLHDADCPVWTGAHLETAAAVPPPELKRVLCAIDLGPRSRSTLCWAAQMAAAFEATLFIVHALPPIEVGPARYFDPHWRVELANWSRQQIDELQRSLGTNVNVDVESGDPHKLVAEVAAREEASLVVIGRGAAKGLGRLRASGYAIVRESPCPVVSV